MQQSENAMTYLDRDLDISLDLNMPIFLIWQVYEYATVKQDSNNATILLNMPKQVNAPEYI